MSIHRLLPLRVNVRFVTHIFLRPVVGLEDVFMGLGGSVGDEHDGAVTLGTLTRLVHLTTDDDDMTTTQTQHTA